MNIVSWSPLREFEDLFSRYGSLLGDNGPRASDSGERTNVAWRPRANILENKDEYVIKLELPEVDRKDVDVSVQNDVISIKGERRVEKSVDDEQAHRIESFYGSFSRSFSLPEDVDVEKIHARSRDGVLAVHLPKKEIAKPRSIAIEVK